MPILPSPTIPAIQDRTPTPPRTHDYENIIIGGEQKIAGLSMPRIRLRTNQPLKLQIWLEKGNGALSRITGSEAETISIQTHDPERITLLGQDTLLATHAGYARVTVSWKDHTRTVLATATGSPHASAQDIREIEVYPRIIVLEAPGQTLQLAAKASYPDGNPGPIPQDFPYPLV